MIENIVFNIIYTPKTVRLLWKFTESILNNTEIRLRIVSNFCTKKEIRFLKKKLQIILD